MRALVIFAGAALLAAGPAASRIDAAGTTAIFCGSKKVGTATVLLACGPAKATVKLAGKTLNFSGGRCVVKPNSLSLVVGKFTIPRAKPKFMSFTVGGTKTKAGTYTKGEFVVSFQTPGKSYSVLGGPVWGTPFIKVTITAGGKKGAFSGKVDGSGQAVTGSWSC
jgi:hypothetical protein